MNHKKSLLWVLAIALPLAVTACHSGDEHPGDTAENSEHAGEDASLDNTESAGEPEGEEQPEQ